LTIRSINQIFLCNPLDGKISKTLGNEQSGSGPGEFNYPCGLTLNNNFIYVCDCNNFRVQILLKEGFRCGSYWNQWGNGKGKEKGQFTCVFSIHYDTDEYLFYVGDYYSVQLFTVDNVCIQRIGGRSGGDSMNEFFLVYGICVIENRLYVSDLNNKRIQIFKKGT